MARLVTSGAELKFLLDGSTTPDGSFSGSPTIDTTNQRSGGACWACGTNATTLNYIVWGWPAPSSGTTLYARAYIRKSGNPASNVGVLAFATGVGGTILYNVKLLTTGALGLFFGTTQIGSASDVLNNNQYYCVELSATISTAAGSDDSAEARIDTAAVFASESGVNRTTFMPAALEVGCVDLATAGVTIIADDVAVNDSTGAAQNSYPGPGKVVLLRPISLNTNGGSWTDDAAATTSAALTAALDNAPLKGIADTTAGGGDHQVRNAAANTSLDMNLATYASAGIAERDTINVVVPIVNVGAPVVTAAKTGSFGITSNPTITNRVFTGGGTAAANFWRGVAAGTFPTGWGWEIGTITYAPVVAVGTSPVARLTITGGTTTRVAMSDGMGLYVDYTPRPGQSAATIFQDPGLLM